MLRLSGFFFLFIAILCAILLFQTSQSVQMLENDLEEIAQKNQKEKDEIRVLETEWDYLNNPQRLESFVKDHSFQDGTHFKKIPDTLSGNSPVVIPPAKPAFVKINKVREQ